MNIQTSFDFISNFGYAHKLYSVKFVVCGDRLILVIVHYFPLYADDTLVYMDMLIILSLLSSFVVTT